MKFRRATKPEKLVIELTPRDSLPLDKVIPLSAIHLKSILVPVDFSECSLQAFRYAVAFAKSFGASITALHVLQLTYPATEVLDLNLTQFESQLRGEADRQLKKLLSEVAGDAVPTKAVVRVGPPAAEIVEAAADANADMIIMSTHGHTGLAHVFLGSVAEKVVRHAKCPVFVVREKEHEFVPPLRKGAVAKRD